MSNLAQLEGRLREVSEMWKSMPRGTDGEEAAASRYYSECVFPLVHQVFKKREGAKITTPFYGLILSVGTSPQPLMLSISTIMPEKVLFLHTNESEYLLDTIVKETGLAPRQWEKRCIDPAVPTHIYREIKDAWVRWGKPKELAIDLTGGTKSMAGGSAMAGALIGAQLVYVASSNYLQEHRRPDPGSEYLEFLPNPYIVFGDLEEAEAINRFRRFDFAGATAILEKLSEKAVSPRRFEALANLAAAYKAWDDLNLTEACLCLEKTVKIVEVLSVHDDWGLTPNLPQNINLWRRQCEILRNVAQFLPTKPKESALELLQNKKAATSLVFTVYANAQRKAARGEYDTAALLLYRQIELMAQRRLAVHGIDTGDPKYQLGDSFAVAQVLDRFNEIGEALGRNRVSHLPSPIALSDGYMLLEALSDPYNLNAAGVRWERFHGQTRGRNHSILAHGFIFISEKQYARFGEMVDTLLDLFCSVEGIDATKGHAEHSFVDPWA
jgi:CRISPR-associated protein (TIGR02710 family)